MPKSPDRLPRTMTQREAVSLLKYYGWTKETGGKHVVKMTKSGERPITLPSNNRQPYAVGLTAAILKQAKLR